MNIEELRTYCLSHKGVTESFPFGPETLVFKVMDKVFLLTGLEPPLQFNVKCDPEKAVELREHFACVKPGYHMNKKYWNTISVDGTVNNRQLEKWISDSYYLVMQKLSKAQQKQIA